MHWAADRDHLDLVQVLLQAGVDPLLEGDVSEAVIVGWLMGWWYKPRDWSDVALVWFFFGLQHKYHNKTSVMKINLGCDKMDIDSQWK